MVASNDSNCKGLSHLDSISVLRAHGKHELRKSWIQRNDVWVKEGYKSAYLYQHSAYALGDIKDLFCVLQKASNDPKTSIIRGTLAPGRNAQRVRRSCNDGFYLECDRRWLCLDIDEGELPFTIDPSDDEALELAALWVRDELIADMVPSIRNVQCVANWSASAGFVEAGDSYTPGPFEKIKLHLWVWLDRPVCGTSLKPWLAGIGADSGLAGIVQPHTVVPPRFTSEAGQALPDPLAWRLRLLPGEKDTLQAPIALIGRATWQERQEKKRQEQERQQKALREAARQAPPTDYTNELAQGYLDTALDKIGAASHGERNNIVCGQAFWIARLVAGNGGLIDSDARSTIEQLVRSIFAGDGAELRKAEKTISEAWKAGGKDPFYLPRQRKKPIHQEGIQPPTSAFDDLPTLRLALADEISLALGTPGTTVLVAPTGGGKSTAAAHKVVQMLDKAPGEQRILWAVPTRDNRSDARQRLVDLGVSVWVANGRGSHNCSALRTYNYAESLRPGAGARWCQACPFNRKNPNGNCKPPRIMPNDGTEVVVVTHALAKTVAAQWNPSHVVWDEAAKIDDDHALNAEALGASIRQGEITGEGVETLWGLMKQSRKIEPTELHEALQSIEVKTNDAWREEHFDELTQTGAVEWVESPPHWRALDAMAQCVGREGKGAKLSNGILSFVGEPPVPDAPACLILDATATQHAARAVYGPHKWRCLSLAPNAHTAHLHINANGGSRNRLADGTWLTKKAGMLHKALGKIFPDALQVSFKDWLCDALQGDREIYFNGTEARGSNRWESTSATIAYDFFVPKDTREERVRLWADLLEAQGEVVDIARLKKEAEYQLEVAPMIQAAGRVRPHQATADNPKTIVTIGKHRRVPLMGAKLVEVHVDEVLLWTEGLITKRTAPMVLEAIAAKQGGLWFSDLEDLFSVDFFFENSEVPRDSFLLNNIYMRKVGSWHPPVFTEEKQLKTLQKSWWEQSPVNAVRIQPNAKGAGRLTYLPPSKGDWSGIAHRAAREGWQGWKIYSRDGELLNSVDPVAAALLDLPCEAAGWNRTRVLSWAMERTGASARTVQRRIKDRGGLDAIRESLGPKGDSSARLSPLEPIEPPTSVAPTLGTPATFKSLELNSSSASPVVSISKCTVSAVFEPFEAEIPLAQAVHSAPTVEPVRAPPTPDELLREASAAGWPRVSVVMEPFEGEVEWRRWVADKAYVPMFLQMARERIQEQRGTS